jgi:hypothetical protein
MALYDTVYCSCVDLFLLLVDVRICEKEKKNLQDFCFSSSFSLVLFESSSSSFLCMYSSECLFVFPFFFLLFFLAFLAVLGVQEHQKSISGVT